MASRKGMPFATRLLTSEWNLSSWSATAALRAIIAEAQLAEDPTARNSKRLPVNAKGDVRLRSVLSIRISGICDSPREYPAFPASDERSASLLFSSMSSTAASWLPVKMEIIAGGASLAPSLWSFPTSDALWRKRSAWVSTALMMQASTRRN